MPRTGDHGAKRQKADRRQRKQAVVADQKVKSISAARFVRAGPVNAAFGLALKRFAPVAAFVFIPGAAEFAISRAQLTDRGVIGGDETNCRHGSRAEKQRQSA